jgi:hypothetical protein
MKTGRLLLGLGVVLALCGGCTTTRTLTVSGLNPIAPTYEHGVPCLQSARTNTVTLWLLSPEYRADIRELAPPAFRVLVRNGGDRVFEFSPDCITASWGGTAVHVFTAGEYSREIDRQAEILVHMVDIGAAGAKEKADQFEAYAATPGTVVSQGKVLYDFSTVEHGSASDAKAQIDAATVSRRAEIETWRKNLRNEAQMMLGRQTVAPGAMAGGIVKLEPSRIQRGRPLRLVVAAGGETHEFFFDVGR